MNDDLVPKIRPLKDDAGLILAGSVTELRKLMGEKPSAALFCAHVGPSMNPTLCELDLLEIVPYGDRPVRVGDVIFFLPHEGDRPVVHRVVGATPEGIRTRGDNSTGDDPWRLQSADIAGRVVAAWRGQKRRRIAGGRAGWLVTRLTRWGGALDRSVSRLLHPLYRSLARRSIVRRLLPSRLKPRVVIFQASDRSHFRLLLGRRVVGRYDDRQRRWHIRRPFRLLVDVPSLPGAQAMETTPSDPVDVA